MNRCVRSLRLALAGTVAALLLSLTACGSPASLTGNWQPDDGTGMKVVMSDGACKGMFYNSGKPLDIGGPMSCSLSEKKSDNGRYSLIVSQPPNQASYEVEFGGNDSATVYDNAGNRLYTMARK